MLKFMRILYILLCLAALAIFASKSRADEPIKIAVIDTGFDLKSTWPTIDGQTNEEGFPLRRPKLCPTGHKDFTGTGLQDSHGHGTHVAGIIATYAGDANYCLIIIKNYDNTSLADTQSITNRSFEYALEVGADIINFSAGGVQFSLEEYVAVKKLLDSGKIFIAAAGNTTPGYPRLINHVVDFVDLSKNRFSIRYIDNVTLKTALGLRPGYYPANYDKRIISVKNFNRDGSIHVESNYGAAFSHGAMGVNALSLGLKNTFVKMTGKSMATPKITGKIIKGYKK